MNAARRTTEPTARAGNMVALSLAILSLAALSTLGALRDSFARITGDEGTYLAMIESAALDGDLEFAAPDLDRVEATSNPGRKYLILHRVGERFFYSKPAIYPFLAAPLYRLVGQPGLSLFNGLVLGLSLWLAWLYLRRWGSAPASLVVVTFAGTGTLLAYAAWTMSDALQVACALAGTALCLGNLGRGKKNNWGTHPIFSHRAAPWVGGALLGLMVAMRITNLAVASAVVGALLLRRRWRSAAVAGIALTATVAMTLGLNHQFLEAARPYKQVRSTFDPGSGYPGASSGKQALERFEGKTLATVRIATEVRPRVTLYAAFYFLAGRHTGLVIYLPASLILFLAALRKPDRVTLALLAGAGGLAAIYLLWLPHNYFGGGAAVGNRYVLTAYPLLLFAPTSPPRMRWQLSAWLIAALAFVSAIVSVHRVQAFAPTSQSHVHAGLFRLLPYESVASDLEGNVERFWLRDWELVRFADPYAQVADWSFTLQTGRPPAEIEIANTRADGLMRFLVLSPAENLELVYEDWGKKQAFPLSRPLGERGVVEITPSKPWRIHQFWFAWMRDTKFHARVFRLSLRTPDGNPARAELRYLGPTELNQNVFERSVLEAASPTSAEPGTSSEVRLRVRNESPRSWASERILPIYLSYRLTDIEDPTFTIEGPRTAIRRVQPNRILEASLEVDWPERPGTYRLEVDLLVEGVAWFGSRVGEPLLSREIVIGAPSSPEPGSGPS